jgi:hypothetical protein
MGMYYEAYFAYGVRIPDDTDLDALEEKLRGSGVGYLHAGHYDRDMVFLTTECKSADLGSFEVVRPNSFSGEAFAAWDEALRDAAERLGVTPVTEPAFFVVPDLS